jgi:hypothetical protein
MKRYSFQTVLEAQSYGKGLEFWVLDEVNCTVGSFLYSSICKNDTVFIYLFVENGLLTVQI